MGLPDEAEDLRKTVGRILRDLEAGHCTPERLAANVARCNELIDMIFGPEDEAPEFEVTLAGIQYAAANRTKPPRLRLASVDGETL